MALESKDFYQKEHEYIFEALINLWANRKTIDVITLSDELGKADYLDVVGGTDYLYEIASFAITATVAHEYGKIVKEKSVLRNILSTCQKISGEVYDQDPVPVLLERIEKRIFDLTQVNLSDSLMHIKDVLNSRVEEYMELVDNPEKLEQGKVNTKYRDLDEVLGGFQPGQLIILAARPSMGKTAFALNCMINAAIQEKKTIAMFSLEMGNEQLVDRILCTVSGTPMHKITK
jgi:replicative DNA helicase